MTNIKRRIITIKGNIEEREEPEAAGMETVRLEIDAQDHLEVAVAVYLYQGDNCTKVNQIIKETSPTTLMDKPLNL